MSLQACTLGSRSHAAGWMINCSALVVAMCVAPSAQGGGGQTQLPTTIEDFFEPGTQENGLYDPPVFSDYCGYCHDIPNKSDGNDQHVVAPWNSWTMSMMAQAARDPVWHAALAIANQDLNQGGDACIRCHSPNAWLDGRSVPTDASAFTFEDFDGVSCNMCHRLVDPVPSPNNPVEDGPVLQALLEEGLLPGAPGNARFVVDPVDVRRGPLDDVPANYHGVPIIVSPFHRDGRLCGTCHDVSNAIYMRQGDGSYLLNAFDAAHPTGNPHDMMPEQRTYSEWLNSQFAAGGVEFPDGRFGGDHPTGIMQSCQDCHMPKVSGGLCAYWEMPPFFPRPDIAQHSFIGANTWVIGAVHDLYDWQSGLMPETVDINRTLTEDMLRNASDMQAVQSGDELRVRIINYSGHKLPTGFPEGRRMWLNVRYFNEAGDPLAEYGAYDFATAILSAGDTKVYEARLAMDAHAAGAAGLGPGESFHLTLNNVVTKDNRIPPMGFTNAAFEAVRAPVVGASYTDGQYWDDSDFTIPRGAAQAVVTLYYQTTSREYIEFLRDANASTEPDHVGQVAYDAWVARGKSAPIDMDVLTIALAPPRLGDVNGDGHADFDDVLEVIMAWGSCPPPDLCAADANGDGVVNFDDILLIIMNWG